MGRIDKPAFKNHLPRMVTEKKFTIKRAGRKITQPLKKVLGRMEGLQEIEKFRKFNTTRLGHPM